ncbi:hypothetical protein K2X30_12260 [bacterium]|nr:hypothetical protein [bacterium]
MNNQFHFKNFEPDFQLRLQANIVLNRTLDVAPYGATAIGLLEKRGEEDYCCALDIYSKQGPFMASAVGETAEKALQCLEEKIKKQISWWKSNRGGPMPPSMVMGHPAVAAS